MESSRTSVEIGEPVLTGTDCVALLLVAILAINAIWRFVRSNNTNAGLLRVNLAMLVVIGCSISVVHGLVDPVLGGRSYLNLFTHLLMIYSGWQITRSLTDLLPEFDGLKRKQFITHWSVLVLSMIALAASIFILDPRSSRGLDAYDNQPAFVAYWVATLFPLLLGAIHLIPRMWKIMPLILRTKLSTRLTLCLLWVSYIGIILSMAGYAITAVYQGFWTTREVIVSATTLLFAISLLMATASIPQAPKTASLRSRQTPNQESLQ